MLDIALPKGRLGDQVYELFSHAGYDCRSIYEDSRKLVFKNEEKQIRYFLVKPGDVDIYVEHGAADVGVVGKDVLLESGSDVYELLDLGLGRCRMAVAARDDYREDRDRILRVATKFTNIAKTYYESVNREIEIIKLHGSIELAPLLGLSDVIVDLVETGRTLEENHLRVIREIMPVSARLIANKSSYRFKHQALKEMQTKLKEERDRDITL
jgi:ATP phosphoribosyltransferase